MKALQDARKAYESVARGTRSPGLPPSAQYRLGEVAYNEKDWEKAVEEFKEVDRRYPKSYVNPEALMGIIYADLALEQFSQAEANLFLLGETFPTFLKEPVVLYAQGIVALHKGITPTPSARSSRSRPPRRSTTSARPTCCPSAPTSPPPRSRT